VGNIFDPRYLRFGVKNILAASQQKHVRHYKITNGKRTVHAVGDTIMSLSIISFLVGAVLAQQFKVRVLIPAFTFVMVLGVGIGITSVKTGWLIVLLAVATATCLQIGYFLGIGVRHFLGAIVKKARQQCLPHNGTARIASAVLPKDNA
jgi:hypothetical protein